MARRWRSWITCALITASACSCDETSPPPPGTEPAFLLINPRAGDVVAGQVLVRAVALRSDLTRVGVRRDSEALGEDGAPGDGISILFAASALPSGPVDLTIEGFAGEDMIDRQVVRVVAEPAPPASATIGPLGGALATASGVIVILPPGALENDTALLVRDHPVEMLPPIVRQRGFEPLMAIDFLPSSGVFDPNFELAKIAELQFPAFTAGGLAVDHPLFLTVDDPTSSTPGLDYVGEAEESGGSVRTPPATPPLIRSISNLTMPGAPLRPLDLAELNLHQVPASFGDLELQVGNGRAFRGITTNGSSSVLFIVPPGTDGEAVTIRAIDRWENLSGEITTPILPRPEGSPDLGEADRRIEVLFDRYDELAGGIIDTRYEESAEPAFVDRGVIVRALSSTAAGNPLGVWREQMRQVRVELLAADPALRIATGALLETAEQNVALLEDRSQSLSTLERIACAGLLYFGMWLSYIDWATPIWTGPLDAAANIDANVYGEGITDMVIQSDVCFPNGRRRRGLGGHECDIYTRNGAPPGAPPNTREFPSRYESDGFRVDPGGNGTPPSIRRITGPRTLELDPVTPPPDPPPPNPPPTTPVKSRLIRGRATLPFVRADVTFRPRLEPASAQLLPIPWLHTPPAGRAGYLPVFEIQGAASNEIEDFFEMRAGSEAGLRDDALVWTAVEGDFTGDGVVDVMFAVGPNFDTVPVTFDYLARGLGNGQFASSSIGAFDPTSPPPQLSSVGAIDWDRDGDLDLFGVPATGESSPALVGLRNDGAGGFDLVTWVDDTLDECGPPSAVAVGDFVPGEGTDVLWLSLYAPGDFDQPVAGTRCLFVGRTDGTYEVRATPLTQFGTLDNTLGMAIDLDGDGSLDGWFPRIGLVSFGDGLGGFSDVPVPGACIDRTWAGRLFVAGEVRPRVIDANRDGALDLVLDQQLTNNASGTCFAQRNGRTFGASFAPRVEPSRADTIAFAPADVDADGWEDLVWGGGIRVGLLLRTPGGDFVSKGAFDNLELRGAPLPADLDRDGRVDVVVPNRFPTAAEDLVFRNVYARAGTSIEVDARTRAGAPAGSEAVLEIDLDGNGDFSAAGGLIVRAGATAPQAIGIGAATRVDVRARFPDLPPAGGNVILRAGVMPGTRVVLQDAQ